MAILKMFSYSSWNILCIQWFLEGEEAERKWKYIYSDRECMKASTPLETEHSYCIIFLNLLLPIQISLTACLEF